MISATGCTRARRPTRWHAAALRVTRAFYRIGLEVSSKLGATRVSMDAQDAARLAADLVQAIPAAELIRRMGSVESVQALLESLETLATEPVDVVRSGLAHSGGA